MRSALVPQRAVSRALPSSAPISPCRRALIQSLMPRSLCTGAAPDGLGAFRSYSHFRLYKDTAALSAKPIPPTWEVARTRGGATISVLKRPGTLLLELAAVKPSLGAQVGPSRYDWGNKLSMSLNVTELAQLSMLSATSSLDIRHGANKDTPQDMSKGKRLAISLTGQESTYIVSLSDQGGQCITVPVTLAEFTVLRRCADFLVPRLLGFDEVLMASADAGAALASKEKGQ